MAVMFQKITLVSSVLLWGYGISQAADTYAAVCDKVSDFRTFLKEEEDEHGNGSDKTPSLP